MTAAANARPAAAADVAVLLREPPAGVGARGLLVPGAGDTVSRERALESLLRGRVQNSLLGELPEGVAEIELARRPAAVTIYVTLPPPGEHPNDRRYPIAIVGGGYAGLLHSDSTRIAGLVSIADVAPAARALEDGREPVLTWEDSNDPERKLAQLDRRLRRTADARAPAATAVILITLALTGLALVRRSQRLARAAVLAPFDALGAALLLSLFGVDDPWAVTIVIALAAAAPFPVDLPRSVVALLAAFFVILAFAPEVNSLAAIGPVPDSGGRFYGVTNQVETMLLAPLLAAAALVPLAWLPALALLALVTLSASFAGADGGGILVLTAGFLVLGIRRAQLRLTPFRIAAGGTAVVALGLALVGIDALLGGSSHVTDSVAGGDVFEDLGRRTRLSLEVAGSSAGAVAAVAVGIVVLLGLALRGPRFPAGDALLVALLVSLVANDAPTKVLGYGMVGALALWAWQSVRPLDSPRCAASSSSPRSSRSSSPAAASAAPTSSLSPRR